MKPTTFVLLALSTLALAAPQRDNERGLGGDIDNCGCPMVYCPQAEPMRCNCMRAAAKKCMEQNGGNPKCGRVSSTCGPDIPNPPKRPNPRPTKQPGPRPTKPPTVPETCGGRRGPQCPGTHECVAKPGAACGPETDCPGICIKKREFCGGMLGIQCKNKGDLCINDPWGPECGMACDAPGICVTPPTSGFCGGFAGFACPRKEQVCVDDPRDDCDPQNGGADCGGICVG